MFTKLIQSANSGTYHLISHGKSGKLLINGKWLNAKEITSFLSVRIQNSKNQIKHLNIYGCEFAKGENGKSAVAYLKKNLNISVSASDDITGKGGDWVLEAGVPVVIKGMENYAYSLQCPVPSAADPDTDGDGVPNSIDVDDDNDGILDVNEGVTQSLNAVANGNFGTNGTSGGNLNNWTTNGTPGATYPLGNNWFPDTGGAVSYLDGVEGLNLYQTVTLKPSGIPGTATFSVKIWAINAVSVPVNQSWGIMDIYMEGTSGLIRLFRVTNPLTATTNSPVANVESIDPIVQNLSVNGNYTARSFATGSYATVNITVSTASLATSGLILFQRKNGVANRPAGASATSGGTDDFLIDDVSYTYQIYTDTDGDGIPNHLDLDSDNDGISDAYEAGGNIALVLDANCRVPYSLATDPLVGSCPSGQPSTVFATPLNTDGDGIPNFLELDSDNDGCPDATEAGVTGIVNTTAFGSPAATSSGLTNVGCFTPGDTSWIDAGNANACIDTDGDGIRDVIDIDDDNDGVLDTIEQNCTIAQPLYKDYRPGAWSGNKAVESYVSYTTSIGTYMAGYQDNGTESFTFILTDLNPGVANTLKYHYYSLNPQNPDANNVTLSVNDVVLHNFTTVANQTNPPSLSIDHGYNTISFTPTSTTATVKITWNTPINGLAGSDAQFREFQVNGETVNECTDIDTDNDGIPNRLDLDSDGDGCPDAVEAGTAAQAGTGNTSAGTLVNVGGTQTGVANAIVGDNTPAAYGANGFYTGIESNDTPTATYLGTYTYAAAINAAISSCFCYKPAVTAGTILDTKQGITSLQRGGTDNDNWPMVRKGAWTALESKTKGFVPNRLTAQQITDIPAANLIEGMMVYNTSLNCLYINTDGTQTGWKCFNTQTCP
ncbi:DUF4347 domain-containing protein [Chryseobacterium scophthalmum]|uniref:DUF4347 domain-containing protein n=1 Tax=Chryseobacterium scophthalmum TaxID=59733 RepID=UPI00398A8FC8